MISVSPYHTSNLSLVAATITGLTLAISSVHAQGVTYQLRDAQDRGAGRADCQEETCSYGPSECEPRGTLLQWSYGTTFGGGPDRDEPLVTDRPDFTESSVTVGRGVAQIEMGYLYVNDRGPGTSLDGHAYPDLLFRYGMLAEWFELRIGWTYLSDRETVGNVTTSSNRSSDLLVGAKLALTPQEDVLPEMAIIPQVFLPVSSDPILGGGEVLPGIIWIYAWELSDRVSAAGSSQYLRALDDETGQPYFLFIQTAVVSGSLTDKIGAYAEWFALIPDGAETNQTLHFFNGGFTYLVNNDLQLDWRAGIGLSDEADDFFTGVGLAKRF